MAPRDPRYRPHRAILWIVYFALIAGSIGSVVVSAARHLSGPHRPPATGALPTRTALRICVDELAALQREQGERAWRLGAEIGARGAPAAFDAWSRDWERRVADLSDRCRLDAPEPDPRGGGGREELARARDAVLALHRAYRVQFDRFGQEGAELAIAAGEALDAARRAVIAGP